MEQLPDITVNLPAELLNSLSEVIKTGLQRAKISAKDRIDIETWWSAEEEMIQEEKTKKQQ